MVDDLAERRRCFLKLRARFGSDLSTALAPGE
jgi:hypothetical protein